MSTEHQRIERIRELFARPHEHVALGIGDDCAVLTPQAAPLVWTVDSAVENVHFSRAFMSPREVGYRAFMAAASDIAAMGARATAALCALSLPKKLSDAELDDLLAGLAEAADTLGLPIVGGNLARASELSLTTTVLGACAGNTLVRHMAKPGDGIFITGSVGGAALGLAALSSAEPRDGPFGPSMLRFLRPLARLDVAARVAQLASAAIDVSDGVLQDLSHLCHASRVGAVLRCDAIPRLPGFSALSQKLGLDPVGLMLGGGEDYELLFTAKVGSVPEELASEVGVIVEHGPVRVLDADGRELPTPDGFDHFR